MHKVKRNKPPKGLDEKNAEFNKKSTHTSEEIANAWKLFSNSALKRQTIKQLEEMFKGCCAYCEGTYKGTSYPQIEHFKPKSLYPELMFDYDNMNIACEVCNKAKLDKYNEKLINPTVDDPNIYLKFMSYIISPLDERGEYTIDLLKLNSTDRTECREVGYNSINDRLQFILQEIENIKSKDNEITNFFITLISKTIQEVEEMFKDDFEYSTMYKHNFKEIIDEFKTLLEQK